MPVKGLNKFFDRRPLLGAIVGWFVIFTIAAALMQAQEPQRTHPQPRTTVGAKT